MDYLQRRKMTKIVEEEFPKGSRIKLLDYMQDDPRSITPGTVGTVSFIDAVGTVHVDWDDGRRLGVVPGKDRFERVQ